EQFVELIRELDERQVAALGVKVGRYIDSIPQSVLDTANELGFALLSLSAATSFDDLLEQVHVRLTDVQAGVLQRTDERSEEHTSELQSRFDLVCRLLLE